MCHRFGDGRYAGPVHGRDPTYARCGAAGWVSRKPESAAGSARFFWSGMDNSCKRRKGKTPGIPPGNGSIQKNLVPSPSARLEVVIARDKGECFSPSFPDKGGVQFQGRGTICFVPHPEGHLVAIFSGYFFSGCNSAWPECALWKRDVSGSNPLIQTTLESAPCGR